MRALAVSYARKGYHVLRLKWDSKEPRFTGGFYEGTTDPDVVYSRWTGCFGEREHWNIGIWAKGLCIPDFDSLPETPEAPAQTAIDIAKAFKKEVGELPDSAVTKTPKNGRHLLLRCPKGMRVPNSVKKIFPGVDIRGDVGYVVAPGCHTEATADGKTATGDYILVGRDELPPVSELAEAPMWLMEAAWRAGGKSEAWGTFKEKDPKPLRSASCESDPDDEPPPDFEVNTEAQIETCRAWLRDAAPEAKQGEAGRVVTKWVIHYLGDEGLTYETAMPLLCEEDGWDATKCFPPWCSTPEEYANLDRLVRDLLSPRQRQRAIGSGHHRLTAAEAFEGYVLPDDDWRSGTAPDSPLPLFPPLPDAKPYPVDALGPTLSRAAKAIASKVQVPGAMAGQSVLASASLASCAQANVMLPFGQPRPLTLFLATIAASGDRKTTADNEALWPVRKYEKTLRHEYDSEIEEWRIEHGAWSAQKRKIEGDGKIDIRERKDRLTSLGKEPEKPLSPFLIAGDPTSKD
jgi:Protein of unknown function (DUF3987)/Bifunctional DNA primase/polymerase, N-terminal